MRGTRLPLEAVYVASALFLSILNAKAESFAGRCLNRVDLLADAGRNSRHQLRATSSTKPSSSRSSTNDKPKNAAKLARFHAVNALIPSRRGSSFAVDRLQSNQGYKNLSTCDRSFCRLLVTTVERRLGQIDKVLAACQKKKKKRKARTSRVDQYVQAVLRVGAAQLLFVGVSAHAAVKETVDVLRMSPKISVPESKVKFANAILRRISREGQNLLAETDIEDNAADWLVREWRKDWGDDATQQIVAAAMKETPRCLTVKQQPGSSTQEQQAQIEYVARQFENAEIMPQGSVRIVDPPAGLVSKWPLYAEGSWWLQDVAATVPAIALYHALSRNHPSIQDLHVVDLCAAPGGKTGQLSNYGFASVTAVEVSTKRCQQLKQNMKRLGMDWNLAIADGTEWTPDDEMHVSGVLVDVPCTATGTGSKRPDVLRRDSDLESLLKVQYRLACHAADRILQTGGILVYATCSLLKRESEDQVTRLLNRKDCSKLETLPFEPGAIPGFDSAIDANGWIRVLPGALPGSMSQCDGFFVARLLKVQ